MLLHIASLYGIGIIRALYNHTSDWSSNSVWNSSIWKLQYALKGASISLSNDVKIGWETTGFCGFSLPAEKLLLISKGISYNQQNPARLDFCPQTTARPKPVTCSSLTWKWSLLELFLLISHWVQTSIPVHYVCCISYFGAWSPFW